MSDYSNNKSDSELNIVVLGLEEEMEAMDFGERTRMIFKSFANTDRVNKIIAIHCPVSLPARIKKTLKGEKKISEKYSVYKKRLKSTIFKDSDKLYLQTMTTFFPESIKLFSKFDRDLLYKEIEFAIKELKIKNYVLWISNPRIVDVAKKLSPELSVFDVIDNLLVHPQMKKFYNKIKKSYDYIGEKFDLICFGSKKQSEMFQNSKELFHFNNGIDDIFFNSTENNIPIDMKKIDGPVIGYLGTLQERFDVELMVKVVEKLPDYNFVLVGPVVSGNHFTALKSFRNVIFLGSKEYKTVPAYMQSFDVAIIPHVINEFTQSMDPLKIYEYLACGKPIVTTKIEGTGKFKDDLYVVSSADEFSAAIVKALSENTKQKIEMRKKKAENHSWDKNIHNIIDKIEKLRKK